MLCHIVDDMWGVVEELFFFPYSLFVVPCCMYPIYDEDFDILVQFCFMFIFFGINCVFIIYF